MRSRQPWNKRSVSPQVDNIFTEANATGVWADRYAESDTCVSGTACMARLCVACVLGSHQKYAKDFADTCQTAGIDLAYINGFCLEELLEDHAIVGMLAGGNTNTMRLQCLANCSVAKDVVWRGRLFDEPAVEVEHIVSSEKAAGRSSTKA